METAVHKLQEIVHSQQWIQDLVAETNEGLRAVADHKAWDHFCAGTIPPRQHQALLFESWPLVEKFPQLMALNLCKCSYGRDPAVNKARAWLTKNIMVEQKHAEWYKDWAELAGVPMDTFFDGPRSPTASAIIEWCWNVCDSGDLAEGMAATNYAIEGATGEWAKKVGESEKYSKLFPENERKKAMRWIHAHATHDDVHPVEALDIISGLVGKDPEPAKVRRVTNAVQKTYDLYLLALDTGLERH